MAGEHQGRPHEDPRDAAGQRRGEEEGPGALRVISHMLHLRPRRPGRRRPRQGVAREPGGISPLQREGGHTGCGEGKGAPGAGGSVGGRERRAGRLSWAPGSGPPARVPGGPSCPRTWAPGSPPCAGTQLRGPAPRRPPSQSRLPGCRCQPPGRDLGRCPSGVLVLQGALVQGPKTSEEVGEPLWPCLPRVGSGKPARLALPSAADRVGGGPISCLPAHLASCLAGAPGHPRTARLSGVPALPSLVTCWGARHLPALALEAATPPCSPGHGAQHLPLGQEAPGPVLGGQASREARLVVFVASEPGGWPRWGWDRTTFRRPGEGQPPARTAPWPPSLGRGRAGRGEARRAARRALRRAGPSPDTLSRPRLFAPGGWLLGLPSPAWTRRPGRQGPDIGGGSAAGQGGLSPCGYGLPVGLMEFSEETEGA